MAIYTSFKLKRSEEFSQSAERSRFSEQYARDNGFQNQADMRGEDYGE